MLFQKIQNFIGELDTNVISDDRKAVLHPLVDYIQQKVNQRETIRINFICTHNSRRSILAQVWAQTMAFYYGVENVFSYSGGTIATALPPVILKTLLKTGFQVEKTAEGRNPVYRITYADQVSPIMGFSKEWDAEFNPEDDFAAVLTCSQGHDACPVIPHADQRFFIPFGDPKIYDGTAQEAARYAERSTQIATELDYIFHKIRNK